MTDLPCTDCGNPEHCTGRYPDTDKHLAGEVRGCFAAKARSVSISGPDAGMALFIENTTARDMDAYKRLRQDGVQPAQIYASSAFEKMCDEKHVIERKPDPKLLERYPMESAS